MTSAEFISFIRPDFSLTASQEAAFAALDGLYREWNAKINVISRKDIDGLYDHHVLHSLAIARYLQTVPGLYEQFAASQVLDLGTGGGFPGIPLSILFPSARFVLCDSVGKKTIVASAVAQALGLKNVEVVNARVESLPHTFDFVVSRAVATLPDLYPWIKGKFRRGILCLKGGDVNPEMAALMGRYRLPAGNFHTWRIDAWTKDSYYEGKLVVHIEK